MAGVPSTWLGTDEYMDIARQPVPDNQEVLIEPPSAEAPARPATLFIDLTEPAGADATSAVLEHLKDILDRMEAGEPPAGLEPSRLTPPPRVLQDDPSAVASVVDIDLAPTGPQLTICVVHVPRAQVDVVLTAIGAPPTRGGVLDARTVCASLYIADWGLFEQ